MIKTFRDKETEKIFNRHFSKNSHQIFSIRRAESWWMLDAAPELNALQIPPGNRLEALKGNRKG